MPITLNIEPSGISSDGKTIKLSDATVWTQEDPRENYILIVDYQVLGNSTSSPSRLNGGLEGLNKSYWDFPVNIDGRCIIRYAAYPIKTEESSSGITYDQELQSLAKFDGEVWNPITPEEALEEESQEFNLPFLYQVRKFKMAEHMKFVHAVSNLKSRTENRDFVFSKRNDLDYINALIIGAEYNFALGLYAPFYEIVDLLTTIKNA